MQRLQVESATDAQLLESVLGVRSARLVAHQPLAQLLESAPKELARLGLHERATRALLAVSEVARRHQPRTDPKRPISAPRHAIAHLASLRSLRSEVLATVLLDARMCLLDVARIAQGSAAHVIATPREVFSPALATGASALLLAHNHPSGNPEPSEEDVEFTRSMRDAGQLLDVQVLDHLILARRAYFSFREGGLL